MLLARRWLLLRVCGGAFCCAWYASGGGGIKEDLLTTRRLSWDSPHFHTENPLSVLDDSGSSVIGYSSSPRFVARVAVEEQKRQDKTPAK
jgi:hypothetical protein